MTLTIHDIEQRSPEWYAARRGILTASTVHALLTVAKPSAIAYTCPSCDADPSQPCRSKRAGGKGEPLKTIHGERITLAAETDADPIVSVSSGDEARSLALLLAAERITARTEDTYQTRDMWRGVESEPFARDCYSENFAPVTECGFMVRDFDGARIGYSPDGLVGDDGLIEVKAPRAKGHLSTILAGTVPAQHMAQIQCGLLVSGRQWCDFISFYGGMPLWPVRVTADPLWHVAIVNALHLLEARVADILAAYAKAVDGLPMTDPLPDYDEITV